LHPTHRCTPVGNVSPHLPWPEPGCQQRANRRLDVGFDATARFPGHAVPQLVISYHQRAKIVNSGTVQSNVNVARGDFTDALLQQLLGHGFVRRAARFRNLTAAGGV